MDELNKQQERYLMLLSDAATLMVKLKSEQKQILDDFKANMVTLQKQSQKIKEPVVKRVK